MRLVIFLFIVIYSAIGFAQPKSQTFEIRNGQFLLNGTPTQIHSGELHYARIPKEYWRHRMKMVKALGLNTIATYAFWNYHNTAPGVWDFETGNRNISEFIKIAKEEGLMVILRPGPYACAEWEFGGYPWWLSLNKKLEIRAYNQPFLDSCRTYIHKLAAQLNHLQITKGGPIIMVQIENEFGSYVSQRKDISATQHQKYNLAIKDMLLAEGFEVPFFTSDGTWLFEGGSLKGALPTANGEGSIDNLKKAVNQFHENKGPYMVAEFYPGWLDHWGEPFVRIGADEIAKQTEIYLQHGVHFNFYMIHGGTNFGFTAGANYNTDHDIQPDITSYDYDAPISEAGWPTEKYLAIREVMKKYVSYAIPEVPAKIPVISLNEIHVDRSVGLFELKKTITPVVSDTPLSFEELSQGSGYVLYSKSFNQPIQGILQIHGLRDYALIYVDGKKIGELNRQQNKYELAIEIPFNGRLDILVENMGRINYGTEIINSKKGIVSPIKINDFEIIGNWKMYKFPFNKMPEDTHQTSRENIGLPTIYFGSFEIDQIGDVFLDMQKWGKGIVFVNGYHLGRYWSIGPQQTLYLPGCWLQKGKNEVVVFEQINDSILRTISTAIEPNLETLKIKTE